MAIKVQGTEVISNSRDLKNIASLDSTTANTVRSALPGLILNATASGTINDGDLVVLNSDGTVSALSGVPETTGTPVVFQSAGISYLASTFDSNSNKVVIAYRNSNGYGTAVVGDVSGTSITFGTPVTFEASSTVAIDITFDSNSNKVVIVFKHTSGDLRAIVGTVSGTSISFGSSVIVDSDTASNLYAVAIGFDSNSNKIVVSYNFYSTSKSYAIVGTVSGTSISFGTRVFIADGISSSIGITFDSNSNKVVLLLQFTSGGIVYIYTLSGTTITLESSTYLSLTSTGNSRVTFASNSNNIIMAYIRSLNEYSLSPAITVGSIINNKLVLGGANFLGYAQGTTESRAESLSMAFDSVSNKFILFSRWTNVSGLGVLSTGKINGTSVIFDTPKIIGTVANTSVIFDSNSDKTVLIYSDTSNSLYGTAVVMQKESITGTYIGISDGNYLNSETATLKVAGAISDAHSSLITGTKYYANYDGTLSNKPNSLDVFVGTAISSTEILVKG